LYLEYWKLREKPFRESFNPLFYFFSKEHAEAFNLLLWGIKGGEKGLLLTGEKGSGKTHLLRALQHHLKGEGSFLEFSFNSSLGKDEFLSSLASRLEEVERGSPQSLANLLKDHWFRNPNPYLVFLLDDAHLIREGAIFEEIEEAVSNSYLSETPFSLLLAGLPSIKEKLLGFDKLNSHLVIRAHLSYFDLATTSEYISFRLQQGGRRAELFTTAAINLIHLFTEGNPQKINSLCDFGLLIGYQRKVERVDAKLIEDLVDSYDHLIGRPIIAGAKENPTAVEMKTKKVESPRQREVKVKDKIILPNSDNKEWEFVRAIYDKAVSFVKGLISSVEEKDRINICGLEDNAKRIVNHLEENSYLLLKVTENSKRFGLAPHMVNVAIIAVKVGIGLGYGGSKLSKLAQAALIHDIGMVKVPKALLEKAGKLTPGEFEEVKKHPHYGHDLIMAQGKEYQWLADIVYQEHERQGGQGYPQGLKGKQIHPFASIIGISDEYEAYSHHRDYRRKFMAYEALQKVVEFRDDSFPPEVIRALMRQMTIFPLNSFVQLNSGEIGRVVATSKDNLLRPTVDIIFDTKGNRLIKPKRIILTSMLHLFIAKAINEEDLAL